MRSGSRILARIEFVGLLATVGCSPFPFLPVDVYKPPYSDKSFVNWESPHVSPLALSLDGRRLYAVNTADDRLEIFDVSGEQPVPLSSIPVGLDPVSVRVLNEQQVWVVNRISDSVSIVDLATGNVIKTLSPGDEPADVAFAADRAFVVCSQPKIVQVYDLTDLDAAPATIAIQGQQPRAIAVSPDGSAIYVAIFESGNHTTLVQWESVSDPAGPYGGQNPPPNVGNSISPPIDAALPAPPLVSLIVRKDVTSGAWLDDNGHDWRNAIYWDQHDHDLAIIDPASLQVSYVSGLMNINMQLTVRADGRVVVVGTEANNHIRFEPNLTGRFVHSVAAIVNTQGDASTTVTDLNPHLADAYAAGSPRVGQDIRDRSIADPRGVVFSADGSRGYICGMGSDNVIVIDAGGSRIGQVDVGQGPTGLALDDARGRLYVLNRFDASISVVDVVELREIARVVMYDPTPDTIKSGRPFLYNARRFSGLGVTACAACHADARTDQLAWDLGNPAGEMKTFNQQCNRPVLNFPVGECKDWHPMKGPMTTQTLQNVIGTEPFHWRGDRENLAAFNPAFQSLLGADGQLSEQEMGAFEALLAEIKFPPNPNRNIDNSLKAQVGDGRPPVGEQIFFGKGIDLTVAKCNDCHNTPERGAGTNHAITPPNLLINPHQGIDVPQIRGQFAKTGFSRLSMQNDLGFGHNHDGTIDGLVNFFHIPNFTGFEKGEAGEQERRDIIAFVMSFSTDTHAGVGVQVTLDGTNDARPETIERIDTLLRLAEGGDVGLIVKGRRSGESRGFVYVGGGLFAADRASESTVTADALRAGGPGSELTWTLVPAGSQVRLGIDRDADGIPDGDDPLVGRNGGG